MKPLTIITLSVMFLLPSYAFSQGQTSPDQPVQPKLKEQVILNEGTISTPVTADMAPESVITSSSKPIPGPVMHSTSLPKSSLEEQILKYERYLNGMSEEYRKDNPQVVENLELILRKKKAERALRQASDETKNPN